MATGGNHTHVVELTDASDDALLAKETVTADSYAFEKDFLTFYAGRVGAVASFAAERVLGVRLLSDAQAEATSAGS